MSIDNFDYDKMAESNVRAMKAAGLGGASAGIGSAVKFNEEVVVAAGLLSGKLSPATVAIVAGFADMSSAIGKSIKSWEEATAIGAGYRENFIGFSADLFAARINTDTLARSISMAGTQFIGWSGGMQESTNKFLDFSARFSTSNFASYLRNAGINLEEYNELIGVSIDRGKQYNATTKEGYDELALTVAQFGNELSTVTELTGANRKEIEKELLRRQEDARINAMNQSLSAAAREEMKKMNIAMEGIVGSDLTRLGEKVAAQQGKITPEDARKVIGLEGGLEYLKAYADFRKAEERGTEDDKKRATSALLDASAALTKNVEGNSTFTQMMQDRDFYKGPIKDTIDAQTTFYNRAISVTGGLTGGKTPRDIAQEAWDAAHITKAKVDSGARVNEGEASQVAISKGILAATQRAGDAAPLIAQNTKDAVATADKLLNRLGYSNAMRAEEPGKGPGTGPFSTYGSYPGFVPEGFYKSVGDAARLEFSKIPADLFKSFKDIVGDSATFVSKVVTVINQGAVGGEPTPRSEGSPGIPGFLNGANFGSIFENFGTSTPATLHGMETVMRPEQLVGVVNKMSAPLQGALSNVVSQINPDQISNAVQSKVTEAISTITAATSNNQEIPAASQAVFEDMRSQLAQLNTTMSSQLREIANTLDKQVRATKGLSPTIG